MRVSKVTTKGRTTVPRDVRVALNLSCGGFVAWEVVATGTASVRRVHSAETEYLLAVEGTLDEWVGDSDEEAYRGL
jgi:bifunctional DNA-binding transcriptional regulator/antitoxin component of YhaV-PrlF toxin-antitoxin module